MGWIGAPFRQAAGCCKIGNTQGGCEDNAPSRTWEMLSSVLTGECIVVIIQEIYLFLKIHALPSTHATSTVTGQASSEDRCTDCSLFQKRASGATCRMSEWMAGHWVSTFTGALPRAEAPRGRTLEECKRTLAMVRKSWQRRSIASSHERTGALRLHASFPSPGARHYCLARGPCGYL